MTSLPEEKHSSLPECPFCKHPFRVHRERDKTKIRHICNEFAAHLPFSIMAVLISFGVFWLITQLGKLSSFTSTFHLLHSTHLFLSATATTTMFWRHDRRIIKAILIGIFGSVLLCGFSDIFMPYLGGLVLGQDMELHICLFEHPVLIYPFVLIGIASGIIAGAYLQYATIFSHTAHIIVSGLASLLYITSFGLIDWIPYLGGLLLIILLAVMIPCCLSDIVFPLLFTHPESASPPGMVDNEASA